MSILTRAAVVIGLMLSVGLQITTGAPLSASGSIGTRVNALLERMTLEEKIGQMTQVDIAAIKEHSEIMEHLVGSVLSGGASDPSDANPSGWARTVEAYQSWAFRTRLKIPLLYGIDGVHSAHQIEGSVIFPGNIGMGATRNPRLVEQANRVIAREMAATGIRWTFAPCLGVVRHSRRGHICEPFAEISELAASLGAAAVLGLQGNPLSDTTSVLACARHFPGDAEGDEASIRHTHISGYQAAVGSGASAVMISGSSWNAKKMRGYQFLVTDVLKAELGFKGIVVLDLAGTDQFSGSYKRCIETAINAGFDLAMIRAGKGITNNYQDFTRLLKDLVMEERVPLARIDDAVRRILRAKFDLGLFEEPFADRRLLASIGCREHREVARECVRQSQVLLKNDQGVLPLTKDLKRLHVTGKAAADLEMQCGGETVGSHGRIAEKAKGGTTLLAAIRAGVEAQTQVTYSVDGSGVEGADAVIVVVSERFSAEEAGTRRDAGLPDADRVLVQKVRKAGIPTVTILLSSRPLEIDEVFEASDAFIAAWLPGSEGQGIADVLFGDYLPTGKLPIAWPQNGAKSSVSAKPGTRFPLGFGLTYPAASSRPTQASAKNVPEL